MKHIIFFSILFCLVLIQFSTPLLSGLTLDNVKTLTINKDTSSYGKIDIKNLFGLGSTIATYELKYNTDQCLINCEASGTVKINKDSTLFDNIKFLNRLGQEKSLSDVNIQIKIVKYEDVEIVNYDPVCSILKNESVECTNKEKDKSIIVNPVYSWIDYHGEILKPDTYEWKITAKKNINDNIDWITETNGVELSEWAWWNTNWGKKKLVYIQENNATTLTNYSILINVTYDSDMMNNFTDLRFTDSSGGNELPYYIENKSDGASAIIWVKIPSITASSVSNIEMYYSNPVAPRGENFMESFIFSDHFDTDKGWWRNNSQGRLVIGANSLAYVVYTGSLSVFITPNATYQLINRNYIVESKQKVNVANDWCGNAGFIDQYTQGVGGYFSGIVRDAGTFYHGITKPGIAFLNQTNAAGKIAFSEFYNLNSTFSTGELWYTFQNDSYYNTTHIKDSTNVSGIYGLYATGTATVNCTVDWVRVRQFIPLVPNMSFSDEQVASNILTINNVSYEPYVYETDQILFITNATKFNESDTVTAFLVWNGTPYTSTITGGTLNFVAYTYINIPQYLTPTNITYYWNFTIINSTTTSYIQSIQYNETIRNIILDLCNSTNNINYSNYSFYDEVSGLGTTGSVYMQLDYYLQNASLNKTLSYTNLVALENYTFCFSPSFRNVYIKNNVSYFNGDSETRYFINPTIQYTNTTTQHKLFLLKTTDGAYIKFRVYDTSLTKQNEAFINISESSTTNLVGSQYTNSSGDAIFFLRQSTLYNYKVSKSPYQDLLQSFVPTLNAYNFTLGLVINNISFVNHTYETKNQLYYINLTKLNSSDIVIANLIWNGTSYTGTLNNSGNNFIYYVYVPIPQVTGYTNISYYWNLSVDNSIGGLTISQTNPYNQSILQTVFNICNSTNTIPYINYSFYDEISGLRTNASVITQFNYYISAPSMNKTLLYNNNLDYYNYTFCFSPSSENLNLVQNIQYYNFESPSRVYNPSVITLNNSITQKTLPLLKSINGIYTSFLVVNTAYQNIIGAFVNVSLTSTNELIENRYTDDSGVATFFLNPNVQYTIRVIASGYEPYTTTIYPTQSSYTLTIGQQQTGTNTTVYNTGIGLAIHPSYTTLLNNTQYNFNVTMNSSYYTVSSWGFNLTNSTGSLKLTNSSSSNGGQLSGLYTTTNDTLILTVFWNVSGNLTTYIKTYTVYPRKVPDDWSINRATINLKNRIASGLFGLNSTGLNIIVFLIIFFTTGILCYKFSLYSPMAIATVLFFLVLLFDVGLGLITYSPLVSPNVPIATILIGLGLVGIIIKEVTGF